MTSFTFSETWSYIDVPPSRQGRQDPPGSGILTLLDVACDSGFGDVSNFNRAFRAEFGVSPRAYRTQAGGGAGSRAARTSAPLDPR